jgi:hypothetical protein
LADSGRKICGQFGQRYVRSEGMYNGNALAWENILVILAVKNGQVKSGAT